MKWRKWNWRKWLDGFVLAGKGILLATREKRFWCGFVPAFLFFGWLINMLSSGFSKFQLLFQLPFPSNLSILGEAFLAIFGINVIFADWLPTFAISLLQGTLIGLIVLLWSKRREQNSANLEKAGIITGLIALGAGCPTCGTTLLTPLLGAIFSTSGLAVTGAISTIVTWVAVVVAILSLRRLGEENYVIIKNEQYLQRKKRETTTVEEATTVTTATKKTAAKAAASKTSAQPARSRRSATQSKHPKEAHAKHH